MKRMSYKSFMDFATYKRNSSSKYRYCISKEYSSRELVSIAFSRLFFHGDKRSLQKRGAFYTR